MADPDSTPLEQLTVTKRTYVEAKAAGATNRAAAAAAGITPQQAGNYNQQPDIQAAFRQLMRNSLSPQDIVGLIKGGATATMPEYAPDGKRKRVADWKTRRPYIQMASEQAGYVETKENSSGAVIQVNVTHVGTQNATATIIRPKTPTETDGTA